MIEVPDPLVASTPGIGRPIEPRSRIGPGPKAEKRVHATLLFFSDPSTAMYSAGTRPLSTNTRSPRPIPSERSTLANLLVKADNCR